MKKYSRIKNITAKIGRFGAYIPLSNLVMIYGGRFMSDRMKRRISATRNRKIQNYLKASVEAAMFDATPIPQPRVLKPESIWICWFQGESQMPDIVRMCLESVRKYSNGHEVIVITSDNFRDYVTLPDAIVMSYEAGDIKPAHFSDIIRVNLLVQQGGLWLDSTMYLTAPIDNSIFERQFYSIHTKEEGYYVSRCRWAVFAMGCDRYNRLFLLLSKAFSQYLESSGIFVDYFMFDQLIDMLVQEDPEVAYMIESVPMNNPEVHSLNPMLEQDYDEEAYRKICVSTSMFKLSYRNHDEERLKRPESTYSHCRQL